MRGMMFHELAKILAYKYGDKLPDHVITEEAVHYIFQTYGDDYFRDYGLSNWELVNTNKRKAEVIKNAAN